MVLSYIIEVVEDADPSAIVDVLGDAATRDVKEIVMTGAEKLRQAGRVQGRVEGQLDTLRRTLLRQLRAKFGPNTPEAEARVAAADVATLETWLDRIVTATRLDDVWA